MCNCRLPLHDEDASKLSFAKHSQQMNVLRRGLRAPSHASPALKCVPSSVAAALLANLHTGARSQGDHVVMRTASGEVGPPSKPKKSGSGKATKPGNPASDVAVPGATSAATLVASPPAVDGDEFLPDVLESSQGTSLAPFMDAVVKVYCVHTEPNYSLPWQRKRQMTSTSSGFVANFNGKRCLLTNAHSVDYHTQVKVKRRGDDRKYLAKVLSIGVDCDVALLDVEDTSFWESGAQPLEFGPLPKLQDAVAVVGYPIGGDTISVTAGVVSRIEVTDYSHGSTDLLAIQIDAAINSGNSGGPVFNAKGQCCGIAFQALVGSDVENVGYVVPTPVVHHFLTDYERTGGFNGFPALGIQWQRMESEALRRAYGLAKGQKGVLVRNVNPTSAAAAALQKDDVILSFDGVDISNDGTVPFRTGERIAFSYLISNKYVGDEAVLKVLRAGQVRELTVKLSKPSALVPPHLSNRDPSYFIVAGLVFTSVSEPYLQSEYGGDYATDSPVKLLEQLYHALPQSDDQEVVVLSQVLACDATLGYEEIYNVQVLRFNGTPIRNLRHLAQLVSDFCSSQHSTQGSPNGSTHDASFMRWDLEYNEVVVLEAGTAMQATQEVMSSHSLPFLMSADLRKSKLLWPPAAASIEKQ